MRRVLALCLLSACAPDDATGPQVVRILAQTPHGYGLVDRELSTLESAHEVRGTASRLTGGGVVILEESLLSGDLSTEAQDDVQQATLVDGAGPVDAGFARDGDILVPTDWESLLMFSFYDHCERGLAFYRDVGAGRAAERPFTAHFYVRITALVAWGAPLMTDNAAFAPLADALLLFPQQTLDEGVPLAANEGVVVHELSHGLKHRIIHGDDLLPIYARDGWDRVAVNSYRSDDEGLADYMAATFTGDPDFIAPSLPGYRLDRDVSVERFFTAELAQDLKSSVVTYNPYPLGSAFASWLWATAGTDPEDRRALARIAFAAWYDLGPRLDNDYRLPVLIDAIMAHAEPALRTRGCALLDTRLEGDFRAVPACDI